MVYGVLLAGGVGKRMVGYSFPKQFIKIGGVPIVALSLRTMLENENIDKVIVVLPDDWFDYGKNLLNKFFTTNEIHSIVFLKGGKERIDSLVNALHFIRNNNPKDDDIVVTHDSVRPFATSRMFDECIEGAKKFDFSLVSVPVNDTIHHSKDLEFLDGSPKRNELMSGQTPSAFNLKKLISLCDNLTEEEKTSFTGTTQLVLEKGFKIKVIKGDFMNFKITTRSDISIAEDIILRNKKANSIQLLDCTLRDGGIAIDFNFGTENIQTIKKTLEDSGINIIELGYINEKFNYQRGLTKFSSEKQIEHDVLLNKKPGCSYVAMIDYGTYNLSKLSKRTKEGIDGIRFAFHKEVWKDAIKEAKTIINKGYDLYIQPMVTIRYSDQEFMELIERCNKELPEAKSFTIVDSFGQMDSNLLSEKLLIADQYVSEKMKIGFHAHNNRQMAFSNNVFFANYRMNHDIVIDSSIMGMGKGAGNLCTELIIPVLNSKGYNYESNGIYELISSYFKDKNKEKPWGYSLDYYLSSLYSCTPSYVNYFKKNCQIDTETLIKMLLQIPNENKVAFNKEIADRIISDLERL